LTTGSTLNSDTSDFNQNTAGRGGGLFNDQNSRVSLTGCHIDHNVTANTIPGGDEAGAGILNNASNLTMSQCDDSNNLSDFGDGDALANLAGGIASLAGCSILDNADETSFVFSPFFGMSPPSGNEDAIYSNIGSLTLISCTVSSNVSSSAGAVLAIDTTVDFRLGSVSGNAGPIVGHSSGIELDSCTGTISDMTISNNFPFFAALSPPPAFGGGLLLNASSITVSRCSITGNGGADNNVFGGGVYVTNNPMTPAIFLNCTIYDNNAYSGGGVYVESGAATFVNCTIAANQATGGDASDIAGISAQHGSVIELWNTLIADNETFVSGFNAYSLLSDLGGNFISLGHNLIGVGDGGNAVGGWAASDLVGSGPRGTGLDPVLSFGGPLLPGSPAVDAGDNAVTGAPYNLTTDHDGQPRLTAGDSTVDIGAYELTYISVNPITPGNLQNAITQSLQSGTPIVIDADPTLLRPIISAVTILQPPPSPVTVYVHLASGTYPGIVASPPPNVTLEIDGPNGTLATFVGHSPALTVLSGTVIVNRVTLTNSTAAPTILVKGGSLTLRDDTVATTGGGQAAVAITGGSIDLGTSADPGGNVLEIIGTGEFVHNTTGNQTPTVGDTFVRNGVVQPAELSFTSLSASNSTAVYGQAVVFTATVAANGPGTPTGAVDFFDASSNTDVGTAKAVNGVATLTTTSLGAGAHTILATYSGDSNFTLSMDSLTINVLYNFPGFMSPVATPKVAIGNLVPIWFQLLDANGNILSNPADISSLLVVPVNANGSLGTPFAPALLNRTSLGFEKNHFTGSWITKGLSAGTYEILVGLNDGTVHTTKVQLVSQATAGKAETASGAGSDAVDPSASLLFGDLNVYVSDPAGYFTRTSWRGFRTRSRAWIPFSRRTPSPSAW
jgi:hypothetical protein